MIMKVMFIVASIGKQARNAYAGSWLMEPLAIAVLSALTPDNVERIFYDDRLESIPFDMDVDLVAINMEAYTALRAYQIADEFRRRNVAVVLGGVHATLMPEEALEHADSVLIGEAEDVWGKLLDDFFLGNLQKFYRGKTGKLIPDIVLDRSIFKGKNYLDVALVETGRGCIFECEFCSVAACYNGCHKTRSIDIIIKEILLLKKKFIFFVDDNICVDTDHAKKLFESLIPLRIKWVGQVSTHIVKDRELLKLMKRSGCQGVLVGFESMDQEHLKSMKKNVNQANRDYDSVVRDLHRYNIAVYASFLMGYGDTVHTFRKICDFGIRNKTIYVAFNHLVPYPGTPLYDRLKRQNRLKYDRWWLKEGYRFGEVVFNPVNMSAEELTSLCWEYRYKFFSFVSNLRRLSSRIYRLNFTRFLVYLILNFKARYENDAKRNMLIGGFRSNKALGKI